MKEKTGIFVCSVCQRACCYQGYFMCDDARTASVLVMTRSELETLNRESPHYWKEEVEQP